jgi:hypothetical protein
MNVIARTGKQKTRAKNLMMQAFGWRSQCHFFPQVAIAWTFKLLQYWRCFKSMAKNNHLSIFNKYNVHYLVFLPFPMPTQELEKMVYTKWKTI